MALKKNHTKNDGIFKSIFIAYGILLLHLILLAALGLLVLFFRGVVNYLTWIFFGGAFLVLGSAFYFIKKIKEEKNTIREILQLPEFSNKDIEIKLLGGAASFKMGNQTHNSEPVNIEPVQNLQLENPANSRIQNLGELSRLYENSMITKNEYQKLKEELLGSGFVENLKVYEQNEVLEVKSSVKQQTTKPDHAEGSSND